MLFLQLFGAFCFGSVIGWTLRYVLAHSKNISVSSLGTVVGSVGGAAITALFDRAGGMFGTYSIGLAIGFFFHVLLYDIDDTGGVVYRFKE